MKTTLLTLLLTLYTSYISADVIAFSEKQQQAMQIQIAPLQASKSTTSTRFPGKVTVPNSQLHVITAPQRGLIETLLSAEGESVTKGQSMARIQSPALLELQSEYLEVYTRYALAKSNYERDQQLNKEGIIAERRMLESRAAYQELLTSLSRVKRMLELSGMDKKSLETLRSNRNLDSTLIVSAPFEGVILEQMTTAGNRVEAADPLYRIANLKPLWLEIHAPLERLSNINIGQKIIVPDKNITGSIVTIGKMVHSVDQGVLVRAEIHEGAEKLHPGEFLQVQLSVNTEQNSYRIPRSAVTHFEGNNYVFSTQADGFLPIKIKVIGEDNNDLVIESDLPADAQIAIAGTAAIKAAWLGGE